MAALAPIVLFTYNRPWHTEQTLRALQKNEMAEQSILYVYSDGAKENATEEDRKKIQEVRQLVKSEHWCGEVNLIEREKNWGLADNIIDGVTRHVKEAGKVIVLEDDIVTSSGFLRYMNDALRVYEDEEKVMHVSGYIFPIEEEMPETFFYDTASCWGWGTWARAWKHLRTDPLELLHEIYDKDLHYHFDLDGYGGFIAQLVNNVNQRHKTWAVKWYASFFLAGGHALHPYPSLVNNIGFDNSGENCSKIEGNNPFQWQKLAQAIPVKPLVSFDDRQGREAVKRFYQKLNSVHPLSLSSTTWRDTVKKFLPPIVISAARKVFPTKIGSKPSLDFVQKEKKRLEKLPRYYPTTTDLLGKTLHIPDAASFLFMHSEIFEQEIYKFEAATDTPYVIDAGANIGLASLYVKQKYPNAKVIAFEPDPEVATILKKNLKSFGHTDVQVIPKALWKEETTLHFASEGADAGRLAENTGTSVEAVRLSSFLDRKTDFLKIDIEGAELTVLEECKDKLHHVGRIFVEHHSFVDRPQNLSKLISILEQEGYRLSVSSPELNSKQPFVRHNQYMGMDMQLNIYAFRL